MSNVLLIGMGKMGKLTFRHLCAVKELKHFHIVDTNTAERFEADNVTFYSDINQVPRDIKMDYAFILTPGRTHFEMMRQAINLGIKNIFVEKPAVCTPKEMQEIKKIGRDCKIVVGYILRQSGIMNGLKIISNKLRKTGYDLKQINVTYVKDIRGEARNKTDMGVFDEAYHIWDTVFNCLGLKSADKIVYKSGKFEEDPVLSGRAEFADIRYTLHFGKKKTDVTIVSSFKSPIKKREFEFQYVHSSGATKRVVFEFDGEDGFDRVQVINDKNKIEYQNKSPSLEKLAKQIDCIMRYFNTDDKGNLHTVNESELLQNIFDKSSRQWILQQERQKQRS